jgi:hypothetical protein
LVVHGSVANGLDRSIVETFSGRVVPRLDLKRSPLNLTPGAARVLFGGGEADAGAALLRARARFVLAYRIATRAQFALSKRVRSRRSLRAMLALCLVGDLLELKDLRSSPTNDALRAGRYLAETAGWSALGGVPQDLPVLVGVPLAAEAGVRFGLSSVGLVVAEAALSRVVSRLAGRDQTPRALYGWQALAAGAGMGAVSYQAWVQRRARRRHDQELSARTQHARLAGQNDVAMGADSVMDRLWRVGWLLGDSANALTVSALAGWKAELAAETYAKAFYLGDVLRQWERRHNQGPVLAGDVNFDLAPGEGCRQARHTRC